MLGIMANIGIVRTNASSHSKNVLNNNYNFHKYLGTIFQNGIKSDNINP